MGDQMNALQTYTLHTQEDGSIRGQCWTNDNKDQGWPSEEAQWEVRYRDYAHMRQATGLSHIGISGVRVEVYLDGERL